MNLLIAVLMYLGFNYSNVDPATLQGAGQDENVQTAQYIIDNHKYTLNDEGVVIDVDVNP